MEFALTHIFILFENDVWSIIEKIALAKNQQWSRIQLITNIGEKNGKPQIKKYKIISFFFQIF